MIKYSNKKMTTNLTLWEDFHLNMEKIVDIKIFKSSYLENLDYKPLLIINISISS